MSEKKEPSEDIVGGIEQALTKTDESDGMIVIPEELPVLTLRNTVLFPGSIVPLGIGRPKTVRLVEESIKSNGLVAVVAQRDPDIETAALARMLRTNHCLAVSPLHPDLVGSVERSQPDAAVCSSPYGLVGPPTATHEVDEAMVGRDADVL